MRSLRTVLEAACSGEKSLASLSHKYGRKSLSYSVAEHYIRDRYRIQGGKFGQLGESGEVQHDPERGYWMDTQLGTLTLHTLSGECEPLRYYTSTITLSGIHCFAAQDDVTDELFAVISLINVNPTASGVDQLVKTFRTPIVEIESGETAFQNVTLGNVPLVGTGIRVHISLWDHESGDADEIRDQIAAVIEDAAKKGQQAIVGGALGSDAAVTAGKVGDVTEFEIGGVKPFHILSLGIAGLIANALADDLLGDNTFWVPAQNLKNFADPNLYANSIRYDPAMGGDIPLNWPPPGIEKPFNKKGALYKAFFKITTTESVTPCDPPLGGG
ncbi:hypothetical protein AMK01_CH01084 [Rhizobium sp. N6212]|uniref:hypothetical protein n=2 Tax=Rhizobium/Agrobacterium group TaxID=227290 RepID=UPI0007EAEF86|nr:MULTISPECIES: hypothetical protein [Rhizobium]ANK90592.1 hypothetical protein AMK01_CH01084 [Rhizobium sp. N6212]ANK96621.1 hypothetical protein AMK00_CH01086 [Rhizobium sp. N621]ANL20839.1 hypothetical protein AMJ96_CH01079 [Rhizobium sp. N113]ANL02742.1 hypothetical protein AMJ99_CH01155 [Rhizobium esperanzae]ANL08791.1 hypothetical protein AMJ98_CH01076 [Rhizobium sp. N1341]